MLTESNLVALLILSFIVHGWQYWNLKLQINITRKTDELLTQRTQELADLETDYAKLTGKVTEFITKAKNYQ
jgi:hypothetical protein